MNFIRISNPRTPLDIFKSITTSGSSELSFPFHYEEPEDYFDYVIRVAESYYQALRSCDPECIASLNGCLDFLDGKLSRKLDLVPDIKELNDTLYECIGYLYKGNIPSAYDRLEQFFIKDDCHYLNLLPMINVTSGMTFYRIRNDNRITEQKEIFHIPFEMRTKVRTERFSIPGYPVLYLSSSFDCAWEETGKEDLSRLSAAKFRLKNGDYDIIDFVPPLEDYDWPLFTWLLFYPLIMACSVEVREKNDPYKPEYALPQIFLQILRDHAVSGENEIIGIRYLSTKIKECDIHNANYQSYVFPTTLADKKFGFCPRLSSIFTFSDPVQLPQSVIDAAKAAVNSDSDIDTRPVNDYLYSQELKEFRQD